MTCRKINNKLNGDCAGRTQKKVVCRGISVSNPFLWSTVSQRNGLIQWYKKHVSVWTIITGLRVISRQTGRDFKADSTKFSVWGVDLVFVQFSDLKMSYQPCCEIIEMPWPFPRTNSFWRFQDRDVTDRRTDTQTDGSLTDRKSVV